MFFGHNEGFHSLEVIMKPFIERFANNCHRMHIQQCTSKHMTIFLPRIDSLVVTHFESSQQSKSVKHFIINERKGHAILSDTEKTF